MGTPDEGSPGSDQINFQYPRSLFLQRGDITWVGVWSFLTGGQLSLLRGAHLSTSEVLYDQGYCTCVDLSASLLQLWGLPPAIAWWLLKSAWSLEWMGRASAHGR